MEAYSTMDELLDYAELIKRRDEIIYRAFREGAKQREIGELVGLSESRVKAICGQQKSLAQSVKV